MEDASLLKSGILDNNGTLFDNDPVMIDYEKEIFDYPVLDAQAFSLDPRVADCDLSEDMLQLLRATEQPREPPPPSDQPVWPPALGEPTPMPRDKVFFEGLNSNEIGRAEIPVYGNPTPAPTPMVPSPSGMPSRDAVPINYGQLQGFARASVKPEPEMAVPVASQAVNPHNPTIQQICGCSQQSNSIKETATKEKDVESAVEKPKRARTAAEKKEARAERNRQYARRSRLRLKLQVQSMERSVLQKRKRNVRLQMKLDNYMQRFEMVLARGGASGKDPVLRALEICRATRRKCTWTYQKSRHEQVEIKPEGQ